MHSLGGAVLILVALSGSPDPADAARIHEARYLSNQASKIKCRRLATFEVRGIDSDGHRATVDAFEHIVVSPAGGMERIETARVRLSLVEERGAWSVAKRESLDDELAASGDVDRILGAPELWTSQLSLALSKRAVRLNNESRKVDADRSARAAEQIAGAIGDAAAWAQAVSVRSIAPRYNNQLDLSLALARESAELTRRIGDADLLAPTLLRLGRSLADLFIDDPGPFKDVLTLEGRVEDIAILGLAASQLARYYDDRNEHRHAFRYTNLSMRYADLSGNAAARTAALLNLAGAYNEQGDFELASEYWQRCAVLARESGFPEIAANALRFSSNAERQRGNLELALKLLDDAIGTAPVNEHAAATLAGLHVTRAAILLRTKRLDEASRALDAADALDVRRMDAATVRAQLLLAQDRADDAIELLFELAKTREAPLSIENRVDLARAWKRTGRIDAAITVLRDTICEAERERANVTGDARQRWLFLERTIEPYRDLLELLVEIGDAGAALEVAESMKARALAESIADEDDRRQRNDQEQRIDAEIRQLNVALQSADGNEQALRKKLLAARIALADARARLRSVSSAHVPHETRRRSRVDDAMVILEYVQTNDSYVLFVLQRDQAGDRLLAMHRMNASDVDKAAERAVQAVRQRNLRYDEYARPLYELLIAPAEPFLRDAKMIGIVPDGSLWRVPFQALPTPRGYLIERAPLFFAPSLALLDQTPPRRRRPPASVMAFAHQLPETDREVRAIASLYDRASSLVLSGDAAREAVLKSEGGHYDILHFATHGVADEAQPLFSYLKLSADGTNDDGLLEAREIAALDLRAEVAVLSACSTAGGRVHAGEGVIGLSWAFLAAGCPRTVVSQWDAASTATSTLMHEFHRSLRAGNAAPTALRTAALALRRNPQYRHPFYWAPFVVVGAP